MPCGALVQGEWPMLHHCRLPAQFFGKAAQQPFYGQFHSVPLATFSSLSIALKFFFSWWWIANSEMSFFFPLLFLRSGRSPKKFSRFARRPHFFLLPQKKIICRHKKKFFFLRLPISSVWWQILPDNFKKNETFSLCFFFCSHTTKISTSEPVLTSLACFPDPFWCDEDEP